MLQKRKKEEKSNTSSENVSRFNRALNCIYMRIRVMKFDQFFFYLKKYIYYLSDSIKILVLILSTKIMVRNRKLSESSLSFSFNTVLLMGGENISATHNFHTLLFLAPNITNTKGKHSISIFKKIYIQNTNSMKTISEFIQYFQRKSKITNIFNPHRLNLF